MTFNWVSPTTIKSADYTCGHCGKEVGSDKGYSTHGKDVRLVICPRCCLPTLIGYENQIPAPMEGRDIQCLPKNVEILYNEIRQCFQSGSPTPAVLAARVLLIHIAEEKGAEDVSSFQKAVKYLDDKHIIPKGSGAWVDQIRVVGNEVNHDLLLADEKIAKQMLSFVEMLLLNVYEFPSKASPKSQDTKTKK